MIGEFATAVEAQADLVFILMNDRGYGVIRNIQDAQYESRHVYSNILTPDFALVCAARSVCRIERVCEHRRVSAPRSSALSTPRARD